MAENVMSAIERLNLRGKLFQGFFGLEVEEHRITTDGRISRYPYPAEFGSRLTHPYLQSDFTDSMLELITEPTRGGREAVLNLKMLQQVVQGDLHQDERIWPFSMPPRLQDDDLQFAHTNFTRTWVQGYRDYLESKYGIEHEIVADAHINYSLNETLLKKLFAGSFNQSFTTYADFKNDTYFKLAQNFVLYRWLFTYLFGASPLSENHYSKLPVDLDYPVRSLRNSSYGYSNREQEEVTYLSLKDQINQLQRYVDDGTFYSIHEFYGPVRFKAKTDQLAEIERQGINYLEFRSFDLDPLSRAGVSDDTLDLLEIFLIASMDMDLPQDLSSALSQAAQRNEEVALGDPMQQPVWLVDEANQVLDRLKDFVVKVGAPRKYAMAIEIAAKRVRDVKLTLGAQLVDKIEDQSLVEYGLKVANDRYLRLRSLSQPLQVMADRYSESIQQLIKEAIVVGIRVRLVDDAELILGDHRETFSAQMHLDFPKGVREYLEAQFPEIKGNA